MKGYNPIFSGARPLSEYYEKNDGRPMHCWKQRLRVKAELKDSGIKWILYEDLDCNLYEDYISMWDD